MQLYLEKPEQEQFWEITWEGTTVTRRAGTINSPGEKQQENYATTTAAFEHYIQAAQTKIEEGYTDPRGTVEREQLDAAVYEQYLKNQQFDAAVGWLNYFGHLENSVWEDQLIEHYIQKEDYTAAEKYILGNLQSSQDGNVVIRQLRYLSTINPMLSRFMLGNLPLEVNPARPEAYYKELAQAQAKIAFFDTLSGQLRTLTAPHLQLIYLTNLLDTPHEKNAQQLVALERAQLLLKEWDAPVAAQKEAYQQLIAGAERIGQLDIMAELQAALKALPKED